MVTRACEIPIPLGKIPAQAIHLGVNTAKHFFPRQEEIIEWCQASIGSGWFSDSAKEIVNYTFSYWHTEYHVYHHFIWFDSEESETAFLLRWG